MTALAAPPGRDTPLRLAEAARLAFPDGSVTAATLRRERDRGTLDVSRVGGRDYTTLAAVEEMLARCRVLPRDRDCGSNPSPETPPGGSAPPSGASATDGSSAALDSARRTVRRLTTRG